MYNEEVKRKFLEWYQKDHVVDARFEKWFNDIELFEREFGMDFSELSEEEMRFEKHGSDKFGVPYTCEQIEAQFRQARTIAGESALTRKLSFKKARKSGVFNRLYRVECSGVDVFDTKNKPVVLRIIKGFMTYRDFLQDYKAFKEAFNL